jgi:hypothetical protein
LAVAIAFTAMAVETSALPSAELCAQGRRTPVKIETYVDGADVFIDGKHVGTTPLRRSIKVRPGERVIRVTRRGYADYFETVRVPRRKRRFVITAELIPITGVLIIESTPSGAQVTMAGAYLGDTPFDGDIDEGEQTILVGAEGYLTHSKTLSIIAGETHSLQVRLEVVPTDPFYTRWWFWTGIAALAAGTTIAIALATDNPDTAPNPPTIRLPLGSW